MKKSVEGSCQDQHDCKDDSRTSKKRSRVASPRSRAPRVTNREKQLGLGDQSDRPQQSHPTQLSKLQQTPVIKKKRHKTSSPKVDPVYNLRSRVHKTEGSKDSPAYNLRSKVRKTENPNASTLIQKRGTPKTDCSKDSSLSTQKKETRKIEVQRISGAKISELPVKQTGITKHINMLLPGDDKKNRPSSIQYEPFFRDPVYHIRWEGDDMENESFGQNCMLCKKDLSGAIQDDDSLFNEYSQFEDDDDDGDDYYDDLMPRLLPAVDILLCGHAFHTECLQQNKPEEHSSDPQCIICANIA